MKLKRRVYIFPKVLLRSGRCIVYYIKTIHRNAEKSYVVTLLKASLASIKCNPHTIHSFWYLEAISRQYCNGSRITDKIGCHNVLIKRKMMVGPAIQTKPHAIFSPKEKEKAKSLMLLDRINFTSILSFI